MYPDADDAVQGADNASVRQARNSPIVIEEDEIVGGRDQVDLDEVNLWLNGTQNESDMG